MKSLSGKNAIVTGSNQGLGKSIAEAFLKAGANVLLCARDEKLLAQAYEELKYLTDGTPALRLLWQKCDVTCERDVDALVNLALQQLGGVDVLVNNAGVYGPMGSLEDVDWKEWKNALEINLYGPVLMCRAVLGHFKQKRAGKIINISGGGATAPLPNFSSYAAAKAAIVRLTETLAHEVSSFNIDVNAIAPGALNTRLLDQVIEEGPEKVGQAFYDRSLKQKEEGGASLENAAQLCVFLASKEADGISGRLISAVWDPWKDLSTHLDTLKTSDIYTLRRIVPSDRGLTESWRS